MKLLITLLGLAPEVAAAIAASIRHVKRGEAEDAAREAQRAAELQRFRTKHRAKRPKA